MTRTRQKLSGCIAVAAAVCCVAVGCGGGDETGAGDSAGGRLDLLIADCSKSFRASSERLLPAMVTIAADSAEQDRALWAGCFAEAPLRTLVWDPKVDFGVLPKGVNPSVADRVNVARALGMEPKLLEMIRETPDSDGGSGQLEALEVASETEDLGRLFLFTDAAIHQDHVPDMTTATPAEIRDTIEVWAPRLRGLRGVHLVLVGVGFGVHNSASVRNAKLLFHGLADRVGAASFKWTQELPVDLPTQESS